MTDCNPHSIAFPHCKGRLMEASFSGGAITSDGGAVLLRQADRILGLTDRAARSLTDTRRKASCRHSLLTMVRQRVYALALGYEDLNDHEELRSDPALQTAVDADGPLAGASTLCRIEQGMGREDAVRLHEALVGQFIASFPRPPRRLVLDFDATDDPVHGGREGRFFHGYHNRYCFPPLYVFCGDRPLAAWLRSRRVIVKAEHAVRGANPRYVVTSLKGAPQWLYDRVYCARGDMENRIKEQQLDLFADRTSCHAWWPNQYRLPLSAMAYVLLEAIRRIALAGGELARAYVGTIRLKLLKIGAVVLRNTRRIRLPLSNSCPHQELFHTAAARLQPG